MFSHPSNGSDGNIGQLVASESNSLVNDAENNVIDSPNDAEVQDLISPSPLVSWRAGCNIERGRQLFLLTPLPISKSLSSKHVEYSKSVLSGLTSGMLKGAQPCFIACEDLNESLLEDNGIEPSVGEPSGSDLATLGENMLECNGIEPSVGKPSGSDLTKWGENLREGNGVEPSVVEPSGSDLTTQVGTTHKRGFASTPLLSKRNCSMLVMTPCLKMSPPKSCVLLEPISESSHKDKRLYKATPFPVGVHDYSSGSDDSDGLGLKYPELLGIQQAHKSEIRKKKVEASPDWFMSPPKTCVLLEPSDSQSVESAANDGCQEAKKSFGHEGIIFLITASPSS